MCLLMTLLPVVKIQCCLTRFELTAVCQWLVTPWYDSGVARGGICDTGVVVVPYQEWLSFCYPGESAIVNPAG